MNDRNPKYYDLNERLNKTCPKCGSDKISFLFYGLWDDDLEPLIDSREVILGGCVIGEVNLGCRDCEHGWASVPRFLKSN